MNNNGLIDLHTHSCYSDGDLNPNDLIKLAISNGIKTIAITDHDTLLGNQNINKDITEIKIIPGIELSAKVNVGRMHILGYGIDIYDSNLNNKLQELQENSVNSVFSLITKINKDYNIEFTSTELDELKNATRNIGRPDIAKLCVKHGYASNVREAFDKYLIESYDEIKGINKGISYLECIELILKSGGIPVLAHPNTLEINDEELLNLLMEMKSKGLMGIEVYHSKHTKEQTDLYLKYAKKLDLLISGGTDYHGPLVDDAVKIGTGINNNVKIKELSILKKL